MFRNSSNHHYTNNASTDPVNTMETVNLLHQNVDDDEDEVEPFITSMETNDHDPQNPQDDDHTLLISHTTTQTTPAASSIDDGTITCIMDNGIRSRRRRRRRNLSEPPPPANVVTCVMNILAKMLLYVTFVSLTAAIVWYSYELFNHGTDPHLIAWFSAGAFVLMGFPISMWGIVAHLANYNQPHVQVYVVRILWMVPIYSIESWLAMRFHKQAIYIETLRDLYESYVLYSFTQFLIQVLGGEQALIAMLKDKSPTRGVHMWGLQYCVKPWLMGQPVRVLDHVSNNDNNHVSTTSTQQHPQLHAHVNNKKRVYWKSPFFIKCKLGVLQYVLLKFVSAIAVLLLEWKGWYHEGDFTWKGSYLYICILTNLSQCWALYCLIFFYYATKTELSPIRPVGKFLSVKALVFFTWWQSVLISILYQMDMIPHYSIMGEGGADEWTAADVAKAMQDYLICIEMFLAAVVHTFVFPHTEYTPMAVEARTRALVPTRYTNKMRLGRNKSFWKDDGSKCSMESNSKMVELATLGSVGSEERPWQSSSQQVLHASSAAAMSMHNKLRSNSEDTAESPLGMGTSWDEDEYAIMNTRQNQPHAILEGDEGMNDDYDEFEDEDNDEDVLSNDGHTVTTKPGFMRALLDSTIPLDLRDNTVGIIKGDYVLERKSLLQHATTSDQYDLFSHRRPFQRSKDSK